MLENILMKTPSIYYIMWRFTKGGVELSINHYINHFWRQYDLNAYSLRTADQKIYDDQKIKTTAGKENNWTVYFDYFSYCRKNKEGLFHLLNGGPIILILTILAGVKKPIYHIRGTIYWDNNLQRIYLKTAWLLVRLLHSFRKVVFIANSQHSADIFRKKVLGVNPLVIYNGIAVAPFVAKRYQRTSLHRLGYAGRLHAGKNVELVIQLFETIAGKYPDIELHLAGEGPLHQSLQNQIDKSLYADRIFMHGFVEDMPSFYASLDLLLFLSAYESFGNVLAEALLTGLPTLTSNIPVFNEIYGGENDFTLGNPSYYETLHKRFIEAVATFPQLADKAMRVSYRVEKKFNIDQHLTQFEKIYANH